VGPATPARTSSPDKLPFTPDTIKEIVRAKQPDIERCWEQTLAATDKPVDGKLQTHFVITPVGSVKQAKVVKKGTTLKDPALHRCVATVLSTMLFPGPPTGRITRWSTRSTSRPSLMRLQLTETQALIRNTARTFAGERVAPGARDRDRAGQFPAELLSEMAELGLLGVNVPAEYGGAEAGAISYALAMMEIAEACASTAVAMAVTNMCAELITAFGTEQQKRKYVTRLTSGQAVAGAFALSEAQAGSDAPRSRPAPRRTREGWVLSGSKQWITSGDKAGGHRGLGAVRRPGAVGSRPSSSTAEPGVSSPVVTRTRWDCGPPPPSRCSSKTAGSPRRRCWGRKAGVPAGDDGARWRTDRDRLAGVRGGARGADRSGALHQGAEGVREIGVRLPGRPFMLANIQTELAGAELMTLRAAGLKESGKPFTREASMAKVFASEMANRAADKAVQLHGGYGYIDEFPVERHLRDARVQTIYEGTSEIQRLVIARELLKAAG
jgi:alkylation response protein AidB-like acyl-CoA dehydrogenase